MTFVLMAQILIGMVTADLDKAVEGRFLSEYPSSSAKLEAHLSKVQGVGRVYGVKDKQPVGLPTEVKFACNGPLRKFEFSWKVGMGPEARTVSYVRCSAGEQSFQLEKSGDGPYRIKSIGGDVMEEAAAKSMFGKYLDAPWTVSGFRLSDYMKAADFRIVAARELGDISRKLIEIEFTVNTFKDQPNRYRVKFDPGKDWAIVESEFRLGSSTNKPETMIIDYPEDGSSTPAFPTQIAAQGFNNASTICKFDKISLTAPPESDFKLEFYGLKDVMQYAPNASRSIPGWAIALGVILGLFLGSVALRKLADRRG